MKTKSKPKTAAPEPPTYAKLGADLLEKIKIYNKHVGAKTFGATEESRAKACELESEIACAIARRGIIRKMAETVDAAIRNAGFDYVAAYPDASSVEYTRKGPVYRIFVAATGSAFSRPEVVARALVKALKSECGYKAKWTAPTARFVELEIHPRN